ncbi:CDP-alcohol phosphatidyltransferase family protein [Hamadaea sp. NPDC051192]|uniref:CDP-alcohol phosphatidyltransferase family protein n=1 Tax=Hamadaea sp. NPDC051192 TaxID=3154940 RepID=UPI00342B5B46
MIGDGATDWTETEGEVPAEPVVNPRAIMDWPRFVTAWAAANDGFDLRHAGPGQRWWARLAYRCGIALTRIGGTAAMTTAGAVLAALFVPLIAAGGGRWPLLAVVLMGIGLLAEAASRAVSVLLGGPMRREAFYRSLAERAAELCWLWAAAALGAATLLILICGVLMAAHEYVRARAMAGGMRPAGTSTVGDRPLRIACTFALLIIAAVVYPLAEDLPAGTSTLVLALWALLGLFGFVQLLAAARKGLRF